MIGTVVEFDPVRRFGRVVGTDEVVYFVHTVDVKGPRLVEGCRVEFVAGWARHRPRALEVRRLEAAPEPQRQEGGA